MEKIRLTVNHSVGLHARPAAQFVKAASGFQADISVANTTEGGDPVDAKSILSVLTLGVQQGYEIEITADGLDATEALKALTELVESNFGE
jgi:phosphotransferase system HPr (HPr) family protein